MGLHRVKEALGRELYYIYLMYLFIGKYVNLSTGHYHCSRSGGESLRSFESGRSPGY